jgi:glucose/mannose-6-phosphate isomerase
MLDRILEFPSQIRTAWSLIESVEIQPPEQGRIQRIVVLGMGGSAIGGDLVAAVLANECHVPISVHRGYELPAWVDATTLVIASSYSGNTEETLSSWNRAADRDAMRVAITTGGKLADDARDAGAPLVSFYYDSQPRAALGYSYTLLLGLLARLELVTSPVDALAAALSTLSGGDLDDRPARKALFRHCADKLPVILAAEHLIPVARRWVTQINENSKSWAIWNEYPELDHNLIVGLSRPGELVERGLVRVIQLRSDHYHPQVIRRMDITRDLFEQAGLKVLDYYPNEDQHRIGEQLQTIWQGDFLSYDLAEHYQVDPTPVPEIETLKSRLASKP